MLATTERVRETTYRLSMPTVAGAVRGMKCGNGWSTSTMTATSSSCSFFSSWWSPLARWIVSSTRSSCKPSLHYLDCWWWTWQAAQTWLKQRHKRESTDEQLHNIHFVGVNHSLLLPVFWHILSAEIWPFHHRWWAGWIRLHLARNEAHYHGTHGNQFKLDLNRFVA